MTGEKPGLGGGGIERRKFGRRETFKRAQLVLGDGHAIAGIVVDISAGGARVQLNDTECRGDSFSLVIMEDDFIASCRIVRRGTGFIGVEFTSLPRRASRVATKEHARARAFAASLIEPK
jgi:hypothetical protein